MVSTERTHALGGREEKAKPSFRFDIQGTRAIAVLVVVLFHAGLGFPGGFVGVDVFFVVSGYVITRMLRAEQTSTGSLALGAFYLRRIRRILPALAVTLTVVLLTAPLLGPATGGQVTRRTAAAGALFASNLYLARAEHGYFDPVAEANPFMHIWSLSVEEQFYMGFPLLLLVAWTLCKRRRRPGARLAVLLGATAVASFGLNVLLMSNRSPVDGDYSRQLAFFLGPTRAWEFLAGALVALTSLRPGRVLGELCGWAGAAAVGFAVFAFNDGTPFPGTAALLPVVGTALLIFAGGRKAVSISRLLSVRPLCFLGNISYSWYLWHWPLIVFARSLLPGVGWAPPLAALVSLAPAWISYTWIETPVRARRNARPSLTVGLGLGCLVLPIIVVFASAGLEQALSNKVGVFTAELGTHSYQERPCDAADSDADPDVCTWQVLDDATPRGSVVLIGDSNAGHFSEALLTAAEDLDLTATVQTRSSCAFIDLLQSTDGTLDRKCRDFYESRMAWLKRVRPDVVVLANVSDLWIEKADSLIASPSDGRWVRSRGEKTAMWAAGLERTLGELEDSDIRTVVVHPVPRFPGWPNPRLCAPATVIIDQGRCGTAISEDRARRYARRAVSAEDRAVAATPGAQGVDVWSELCTDGVCSTFRNGSWWYRDWNHLSIHGSHELTRIFEDALRGRLSD